MGKTFSPANIKRFYTNDDAGCKFEMDKDRKSGRLMAESYHFISLSSTSYDHDTITSTYWNQDKAFVITTSSGAKLFYLGPAIQPFVAYPGEDAPHQLNDYQKTLKERDEIWEFVAKGKQLTSNKKEEKREKQKRVSSDSEKKSVLTLIFKGLWWIIKGIFKLIWTIIKIPFEIFS